MDWAEKREITLFETAFAAILIGFVLLANGCSTLQRDTGASDKYLVTCGKLDSVEDANYCVHFKQGEDVKQTVLYLHGLGDNENVLQVSPFDQTSLKNITQGLKQAIIVTISFGRSWLVTSYPDRWKNPEDATVEHFKTKVLPELKQKFPLTRPITLVGHSMGGQNSATLCSQLPDEFDKCVLLNPLMACADIYNFLDFNCLSSPIFRSTYTKKQWEEYGQHKMLERTTKMPPTYVTSCEKDQFKLHRPTLDYVAKAQLLGLPVVHEQGAESCTHFQFPVDSVLRFINPVSIPEPKTEEP